MSNFISTLIIDDEFLARKRVSNLLNDIEEIKIIGECCSGKEAVEAITELKPNLIFLDIQLTDMSGFDILKQLDKSFMPITIFITAYDEFALKAFDFFAFDYLLKPFKDERFFKSTSKVIELFNSNKPNDTHQKLTSLLNYIENPDETPKVLNQSRLAIKTNGKISFIDKKSIKYIQASGYYAEVYSDQKKYLLRESLNSLIMQLESYGFIRIHRSTIINTSLIKEVLYSNYGEVDVKMQDEKLFRISKTHKKEFQKIMGI